MRTGIDANAHQYLDKVRRRLNSDVVDVFFLEYVSPADDLGQVQSILDELHTWKEKGLIRYVGATAHNRSIALELIEGGACEVLMYRYNMAHRKAEEKVRSSSSSGWNSSNSIHLYALGFTIERSPGLAARGATGSRLLQICATASGSATGSLCTTEFSSITGKSSATSSPTQSS